jgi:hypothetical protein
MVVFNTCGKLVNKITSEAKMPSIGLVIMPFFYMRQQI